MADIQDLTAIEQVRSVVLRNRRRCRGIVKDCKMLVNAYRDEPEVQAKLRRDIARWETALALTKPAWVKKASMEELVQVLDHLTGRGH